MARITCLLLLLLQVSPFFAQGDQGLQNQKIDGYRGIWFELNQKYPYGDKYSGGLGTYTAKHIPLAIYCPEVNKSFFVYGGTTNEEERHLLAMIGQYDHERHEVSKPTVVFDKQTVNDPHDNPSLMVDDQGFLWVFVSGRGNRRPGFKLKSVRPFSIDSFSLVGEEVFTYPQIWNTRQGFFHFFTKYSGQRELYFETSTDGVEWSADRKLAGIIESSDSLSGHYQLSNHFDNGAIIGTFFNRHRNGHPDTRTDLYYVQSRDFGESWEDVEGRKIELPLTQVRHSAQVRDYLSEGKNVYMKDMSYDKEGNPYCLYLTSGGHEPGPDNAPYQWTLTRWTGKRWQTSIVCRSDHNYDMGSLFMSDTAWTVVGPTETGPQRYATGGEIAVWQSSNEGLLWTKRRDLTQNSSLNHGYVRRPLRARAPFCFFWASGNPDHFSISELYFGDFEGQVWKLPYHMKRVAEAPIKVK